MFENMYRDTFKFLRNDGRVTFQSRVSDLSRIN